MITCNLCNKTFKYQSKLNEHKNNKTPCNKPKVSTDCILCNAKFPCMAKLEKHNQSKKHNNNYNVYIENLNLNITNNFIFKEGTKPFSETNLDPIDLNFLKMAVICDIKISEWILAFKDDNDIYPNNDAYEVFFKYFIKIFAKLHFNLACTENNNCIIFSFVKTHNDVIEYFILEIDNDVHQYKQSLIGYNEFMEKFITLLQRIQQLYKLEEYDFLLNYIIKYKQKYLNNKYVKISIENDLLEAYNEFNKVKNEKELEDDELNHARLQFLQKSPFKHMIGKPVNPKYLTN